MSKQSLHSRPQLSQFSCRICFPSVMVNTREPRSLSFACSQSVFFLKFFIEVEGHACNIAAKAFRALLLPCYRLAFDLVFFAFNAWPYGQKVELGYGSRRDSHALIREGRGAWRRRLDSCSVSSFGRFCDIATPSAMNSQQHCEDCTIRVVGHVQTWGRRARVPPHKVPHASQARPEIVSPWVGRAKTSTTSTHAPMKPHMRRAISD
jgi:hypothetical protein